MPPPGGFPRDLATMNLTGWAGLIQDVAQGMKVIAPSLSMEMYLDSMVLLQLLEATTGMGYCRICCQPTPSCLCLGAYQSVPTETWSQMMARIPGQGMTASTGGSITSETSTTEVQELGATSPLPGFTPLDFTNWSLPLPEAPLTGGLPLLLGGLPGIGRQTGSPWALGPRVLIPPMQVPSAPQGMLPICQQRPRQPAPPYQQVVQQANQPAAPYQQAAPQVNQPTTSYQQAVQPPRRPAGRGGVAQLPSSGAAPTTGQPTQECGRQPTRGHGLRGRSASRPGCGRGSATSAAATTTLGAAPPQPGHCARTKHYDPAQLGGGKTSSMYSRSTTGITFKLPSWSLSGCGSGNFSLTASWQRKPKH